MVSVVGNNGNYMINLGPRPDGSFEAEQIALMDELGSWLKKHGEMIYGTRGGPFYPFAEGVSTRKGKKAWIMITDPKAKQITLPILEQKIKSAKIYQSKQTVPFSIKKNLMQFDVSGISYPGPIKVIELTFEEVVGMSKIKSISNKYEVQGANQITNGIFYELSLKDEHWNHSAENKNIFTDREVHDYAFHTAEEQNPFIKIDLGSTKEVHGIVISNRKSCCQERAQSLTVWISDDGKNWKPYWKAKKLKEKWDISIETESMGATVSGKKLRYIKIGLDDKEEQILHLNKIKIYAK
jgi:hypothetical protein